MSPNIFRNNLFYSVFSLMPVVSLWRNGSIIQLYLCFCQKLHSSLFFLIGFYFNFSHLKFLNRYKILSPYTWPHFNTNSVVESIAQIIRSVPLPAAEFGIGLTKVFIRSPRTLYELNEFRNLRLNALATLIQKNFRCYSQKNHFQNMKKSQIMISSAWRTWRVSLSSIIIYITSARKKHEEVLESCKKLKFSTHFL